MIDFWIASPVVGIINLIYKGVILNQVVAYNLDLLIPVLYGRCSLLAFFTLERMVSLRLSYELCGEYYSSFLHLTGLLEKDFVLSLSQFLRVLFHPQSNIDLPYIIQEQHSSPSISLYFFSSHGLRYVTYYPE